MTHRLVNEVDGQYGWILPGPYIVFPDDYAHERRALDGLVLASDAFDDIGVGPGFYTDMVSSMTSPSVGYADSAWAHYNPVSTFYKAGDTDGSPTSTTLPREIQPFVRASGNLRGSYDVNWATDRDDGSLGSPYDSSSHTFTNDDPDVTEVATGADLRGDSAFIADLLGANTLRVTVTATGPTDGYWRLYNFGFRYPIRTGTPPLRQFPRDDGLRRTPGRTNPTSRQGSLRKGPRGNYT